MPNTFTWNCPGSNSGAWSSTPPLWGPRYWAWCRQPPSESRPHYPDPRRKSANSAAMRGREGTSAAGRNSCSKSSGRNPAKIAWKINETLHTQHVWNPVYCFKMNETLHDTCTIWNPVYCFKINETLHTSCMEPCMLIQNKWNPAYTTCMKPCLYCFKINETLQNVWNPADCLTRNKTFHTKCMRKPANCCKMKDILERKMFGNR